MPVFAPLSPAPDLRLGLIGDNIAASRAPALHRAAGAQNGLAVVYDRLVPKALGMEFDALFDACAAGPFRGLNITYPYKERAAKKVVVEDPLVRAMGAVNTVIFDAGGPHGYNTDYSGFMAAYHGARGRAAPGPTCMIGAGGVGRAAAFGLIRLGAPEIRLVDRDRGRAEAVAAELRAAAPDLAVSVHDDSAEGAAGAAGLINCTPVGMVGYEGTPLPAAAMAGAQWCFDAVYTPVETQFLQDAAAAGLAVISGYELFFWQGVHAWDLFSDRPLDPAALRAALAEGDAA